MLAHKTWEREDWQATDNEDKEGEIVEKEDKETEQTNKRKTKRKNKRKTHSPYYDAEEAIRKVRKNKQKKEGEARKIIGEGQNMTNIQEETQNERAKQMQEEAELTILEDTDNWIACDKCKKWRISDRLGANTVTCEKINRKCEEKADNDKTEEEEKEGKEKAREKARDSQENWTEQIKKWKEKYNRVT